MYRAGSLQEVGQERNEGPSGSQGRSRVQSGPRGRRCVWRGSLKQTNTLLVVLLRWPKGNVTGEWMELSHFGSGVRHLVQGWRMFSLGSCCLEWSTSDSAGKALLCSCKWQHEERRDDRETLKVRSLLSIVMGLGAKQTHRIGWLLE